MEKIPRKWPWTCGAVNGLLALLLALPAIADAAGKPVSSRYLQPGGRHIQLQLSVGAPAPATIIVVQSLPPGATIERAQPPVSRFDRQSGEAKWLLKGTDHTSLLVDLHLSEPVRASELRGQIRYKHPVTGVMITDNVAP